MRRTLGIALVAAMLPLAVVEAQNRIVNPEFDTDTSGWTQALSWSPFDRDGCSRSGSGESAGSFFYQWQCVPVQVGEPLVVEYSFKVFPNPDDWFEGSGVPCYATPDCSGASTVLAPLSEALLRTPSASEIGRAGVDAVEPARRRVEDGHEIDQA